MRRWARRAVFALALGAAVVLLFEFVFPWFDRAFVDDPVLTSMGGGGTRIA
jgi:hypothetical protein